MRLLNSYESEYFTDEPETGWNRMMMRTVRSNVAVLIFTITRSELSLHKIKIILLAGYFVWNVYEN